RRSYIQPAVHDEIGRHGDGLADLPLDYRSAWRPLVGYSQQATGSCLSFSLSSARIAPHPPLLNDERRRAGVCWFRSERAQLCGQINRRVVECRVGGAILGGTEPHLGKPDRRDDGEISLVHWRPCEV